MSVAWGLDIAGPKNTYSCRLAGAAVPLVPTLTAITGSLLSVARDIRAGSEGETPIVLGIDAPLSEATDSKKGWRPADWHLRRVVSALGGDPKVSMSPNSLRNRARKFADLFGPYFMILETNPVPALLLMGADREQLGYKPWPKPGVSKKKGEDDESLAARRAEREALNGQRRACAKAIEEWLVESGWVTDDLDVSCDGELDATVCALVAAAASGISLPGLELVDYTLGAAEDWVKCGLRDLIGGGTAQPSAYLLGAAPYYLLRKMDEQAL